VGGGLVNQRLVLGGGNDIVAFQKREGVVHHTGAKGNYLQVNGLWGGGKEGCVTSRMRTGGGSAGLALRENDASR